MSVSEATIRCGVNMPIGFVNKLLMGWNRIIRLTLVCGCMVMGLLLGWLSPSEEEKQEPSAYRFRILVKNRMTPVKNQGSESNCWIYAMLATIETEHLMRGDSVHLSVAYAMRCLMEENYRLAYLSGGKRQVSCRGMGITLVHLMERWGMYPYDAYRGGSSPVGKVVQHKMLHLAEMAYRRNRGLQACQKEMDRILNKAYGPLPPRVYMYGAEYTPGEFARSVCYPGEYEGFTSFTHHPYGLRFPIEVADNWENNSLMNVPIDTLLERVRKAVSRGHGVCWEGDISEPGFSFGRGLAVWPKGIAVTTGHRQQQFECHQTTDDHCMAIVGIAQDQHGTNYFILKNSWGTDNPFGGLMMMSEDYFRMKTIAVFLSKEALKTENSHD